jgi:hypothetical protein
MPASKVWLVAACLVGSLAGSFLWRNNLDTATAATASAAGPDEHDHWCNFDGHWSFWCARDKEWYYTDGHHWFIHEGKHWTAYKFDKHFGREGFEKGEYKIPGREVEVYAPRHDVRRYP